MTLLGDGHERCVISIRYAHLPGKVGRRAFDAIELADNDDVYFAGCDIPRKMPESCWCRGLLTQPWRG